MKFLFLTALVAVAYAASTCDCDVAAAADAKCETGGADGKVMAADAKCTAAKATKAACIAADDSQTTPKKCKWTAAAVVWKGTEANCAVSQAAADATKRYTGGVGNACKSSTNTVDAKCTAAKGVRDTSALCVAAKDGATTPASCTWHAGTLCAFTKDNSDATCAGPTTGSTGCAFASTAANSAKTEAACEWTSAAACKSNAGGVLAACTIGSAGVRDTQALCIATDDGSNTTSQVKCTWVAAVARKETVTSGTAGDCVWTTGTAGACDCTVAANLCQSNAKATLAACTIGATGVRDTKALCEATDDGSSTTTPVKCTWKAKWTGTAANCAGDAKKLEVKRTKADGTTQCKWTAAAAPASTAVVSMFALVAAYLL